MSSGPVSNVGRVWRLAPVLATLRAEIDIGYPNRSTVSDGTIGDVRHRARNSQHNPDKDGYVRALDITRDDHRGPPLLLLAEFLRRVGSTGSQRLSHGGCVIYSRRIASASSQWEWVTYSGENPHVFHLHVGCSDMPAFYKISRAWNVVRQIDDGFGVNRHPAGRGR